MDSPSSNEVPVPEPLPVQPGTPFRFSTFQALRHRNYRLFFFGQLVSLVGTWMQWTAMMWLAYQLTHQSTWPAWVAAALLWPTFLLGPWSGALADRFPKRTLLFWTQVALLCNALVLTELVLAGAISPGLLIAVGLVGGLVQAVDLPTRLAFVMDMVGREDVANAVALNSLLFNSARFLGPLVAGVMLATLGPAACFLLNAVSFLAVLAALLMIDVGRQRPEAPPHGSGALGSGFAYLWERPQLLTVVLVAGTTALSGWPFQSLLPALAEQVAAVEGLKGYSYSLMLSSTGFGALVAALTVATFGSNERRRWIIVLGVLLVGLGLVGLSHARLLATAMACCALIGFGLVLCFASSQATLQLSSEPHNRGQLMGIWAMTLTGSVPLGNQVIGPAADHWGVPAVLAVQGAFCALAAVTIWLSSGFLRDATAMHQQRQASAKPPSEDAAAL